MKAIETKIPGVLIVETDVFGDHRGYFTETYNKPKYEALGTQRNSCRIICHFLHRRGVERITLAESFTG